LKKEVIGLLQQLIATPSFSKEEQVTADIMQYFFNSRGLPFQRHLNNLWVKNKHFNPDLPTILLNSHHDTVKPNSQWTRDPFAPQIEEGVLYGLGANDAGGALVSLLAAFLHFNEQEDLKYNLIYAATAEEEISGYDGLERILPNLKPLALGIVGEPTGMQMAVAEKGLMVLDCIVKGKAGHAARNTGINAIEKALKDLDWFTTFEFNMQSKYLGPVKMTPTIIRAGSQHNVIPEVCEFTVDVRTTDRYTNEEVLEIIKTRVSCEVIPRSLRLKPSGIEEEHPVLKAATDLGIELFGSPTSSDQALMDFPSVKIGPGMSERSHTADEYILIDEINRGIDTYIRLLNKLLNPKNRSHETMAESI